MTFSIPRIYKKKCLMQITNGKCRSKMRQSEKKISTEFEPVLHGYGSVFGKTQFIATGIEFYRRKKDLENLSCSSDRALVSASKGQQPFVFGMERERVQNCPKKLAQSNQRRKKKPNSILVYIDESRLWK